MAVVNASRGERVRRTLLVWCKGLAMGAADMVPGVSGGTIAFITGIYEELVESLRRITPAALGLWWRRGFGAFWREINGGFLLTLFTGVLCSVFSLAHVIQLAFAHQPVLVWSFFFGLILASIVYIARSLPLLNPGVCVSLVLGTAVALGIGELQPAQLPGHWWVMFGAGALAVCAMILPGLSGSFILLLLGVYPLFLQALTGLDWLLLASFAVGCVLGLLSFSHLLSWLLRRYRQPTLGLLTGFLVGSLSLVWPWRYPVMGVGEADAEPVVAQNRLPADYAELVGASAQVGPALASMVLGLVLVLGLDAWARRRAG